MRRAAFLLALFLGASSAYGDWWVQPSTRSLTLFVGEVDSIRLTPVWSGLVQYGPGYWSYGSDKPWIATFRGDTLYAGKPQVYDVEGISPGTTHIRQWTLYGWVTDLPPLVEINVLCPVENPVIALTPDVDVQRGEPVRLRLEAPLARRTTFSWYEGARGDTTHPLAGNAPMLDYTPAVAGDTTVWVRAATTCSTSIAEFHVHARAPRRRSVR